MRLDEEVLMKFFMEYISVSVSSAYCLLLTLLDANFYWDITIISNVFVSNRDENIVKILWFFKQSWK